MQAYEMLTGNQRKLLKVMNDLAGRWGIQSYHSPYLITSAAGRRSVDRVTRDLVSLVDLGLVTRVRPVRCYTYRLTDEGARLARQVRGVS